jgi:Dna[CI] antecedent, DciA
MSGPAYDGPLPMAELVAKAARAIPKNDIVELASIRAQWDVICEAPLRDHCEALAIHEGELTIGVDAGPWLSAVKLASPKILSALSALGAQAPSKLKVVRRDG